MKASNVTHGQTSTAATYRQERDGLPVRASATWVEEQLAIGDVDAEERVKFEQLMPIPIVAGEP
jgi:hypothetical protein